MKFTVKPLRAICYLSEFTINDEVADQHDFGYGKDMSPEIAPDYGCGDNQFITFEPGTAEAEFAKEKYGLSSEEYLEICEELKRKLSFGYCAWCV